MEENLEELTDPYCDPENPISVSIEEIEEARELIKSGIKHTPCPRSDVLSTLCGMEIYVKKEFMQTTGSFKERGARYAMLRMPPDLQKRGIVAASAGNHAQACCYHGHSLGIPVTVVMPETAPIMKIEKCENYHGNVIIHGKNLYESKVFAMNYGRNYGMMYLNGYDHPDILAGQGTVGLEILEQVPGLEAVVVPVGGGGLIAGVCVAVKSENKNIQVIGVEPENAACLTGAFKAGKPVEVDIRNTLADGLSVAKLGVNVYETIKDKLDKWVTVNEQYIALAILRIMEFEKSVVEGAGASTLAAILQGFLPELKGKKVCLILSGGNIDSTTLGRVIDRGLAADGRLVKVEVLIQDRMGGIEELISYIGSLGVYISEIFHERAWVYDDAFSVKVKVVCECRNREHSLMLREKLFKKYGWVKFNGVKCKGMEESVSHFFAPIMINGPSGKNEIPEISVPDEVAERETSETKSRKCPASCSLPPSSITAKPGEKITRLARIPNKNVESIIIKLESTEDGNAVASLRFSSQLCKTCSQSQLEGVDCGGEAKKDEKDVKFDVSQESPERDQQDQVDETQTPTAASADDLPKLPQEKRENVTECFCKKRGAPGNYTTANNQDK